MGKLSRKKKVRRAEHSNFAAAAPDHSPKRPSPTKNSVLAFLAGLAFCAFGLWMTGKIVSRLVGCFQLQRLPTSVIQMENLEVGWRLLERGKAVPHATAKFSFAAGGQTFIGTNFYPASTPNESFEDCFAERDKLIRDKNATCRFDSQQPTDAFLVVPWDFAISGLFGTFFGAIFLCLGFVAMLAARGHDQHSWALRICAGSGFGGIAAFFIFLLLILPGGNYLRAKSWQSVTATVVHSGTRQLKKSSKPEIVYEYRFDGRTYLNNRLDLYGGNSGAALSQGTPVTCWVNPKQPWQSVLERKLSWMSLAAIAPIVIVFVLVRTLFRRRLR